MAVGVRRNFYRRGRRLLLELADGEVRFDELLAKIGDSCAEVGDLSLDMIEGWEEV